MDSRNSVIASVENKSSSRHRRHDDSGYKSEGGFPEHPLFRNKPHSGITTTHNKTKTLLLPSVLFRFSSSFLHSEALSMDKQYSEEDMRKACAEAVRTNNLRASARR